LIVVKSRVAIKNFHLILFADATSSVAYTKEIWL
jgi:hypothetical protein